MVFNIDFNVESYISFFAISDGISDSASSNTGPSLNGKWTHSPTRI